MSPVIRPYLYANRTYRVRKITSGYTGRESYVVVRRGAGRVSVESYPTRQGAEAHADELNIGLIVPLYEDDPRPYAERRADAERDYMEAKSRG